MVCRLPGSEPSQVKASLALVEALGMTRVGNGHELRALAADFAGRLGLPGYDAVYVARTVRRVRRRELTRLLGS